MFSFNQQIAQEAESIFIQRTPDMAHYPAIKHEEILFQFPLQTTNISIVQASSSDQMVNYAPVVHTIPAQTESFVYDVESTTPLLILTPMQTPNGTTTQMAANDSLASSDSGVEVSPHSSFLNEVSGKSFLCAFQRTVNRINTKLLCTSLSEWSMIILIGNVQAHFST